MRVLVTSGGTEEKIDDVRVMTNISTGHLGKLIAELLVTNGHRVSYICGRNSMKPAEGLGLGGGSTEIISVRSAQAALEEMKKRIEMKDFDAVVHAMAVSDFTFRRDLPIKCKSNDPMAFIEYMRQTITTNPKIISQIKKWDRHIILVGFKFEVNIAPEELIRLARESIEKNGCDLVVANDKKVMELEKAHVARFVHSDEMLKRHNDHTVRDKNQIAKQIVDFLQTECG